MSIIIPSRPDAGPPAALDRIAGLDYPEESIEVLLALGEAPSRQRNEAVRRSRGEYLLFLDDDSVPSRGLLSRSVALLERRPGADAVGGPAVAPRGTRGFAALAHRVLSDPWVVGKTASRYRARGGTRETDERELILCNLLVRRRVFEEAGGFDERLYPNEENALLERLREEGSKLIYEPTAVVSRPPREDLRDYLTAIFRYGRGRAEQLRAHPSRTSIARVSVVGGAVVAVLIGAAGAVRGSNVAALPAVLYALYVIALALRSASRWGLGRGLPAALLACATHAAYATGLVAGLIGRRPPRGGDVLVTKHRARRAFEPSALSYETNP